MNVLGTFATVSVAIAVAIVIALFALTIVRRVVGRSSIYFEPWADLRTQPDETLGRSVGELLLHELRRIQLTHERSGNRVDISNTMSAIPTFTKELGDDIKLLESARLDGTPGVIANLIVFVVRTFPFLSPPCRLRGSIHEHGGKRRLQATLENYRGAKSDRRRTTRLWEVTRSASDDGEIPDQVRELAYKIYLDILQDTSFKTWNCFACFTDGLASYIRYMELARSEDRDAAERSYLAALSIEDQNPVVSFNLGILVYMRLDSERTNQDSIELFRVARNSLDKELRARAAAAMANAMITGRARFGGGDDSDLGEALVLAEEAVRWEPDYDVSAKALAFAHHAMSGLLDDEIHPSATEAEATHHRNQAIGYYERTLKLNPSHFVAANNLGHLYLTESRHLPPPRDEASLRKAEELIDLALGINPAFSLAADNRGEVRLRHGDYVGAQRAFEAALRIRPRYPEAANDVARALLRDGSPRVDWQAAIAQHVAALGLTAETSPGQQHKLCASFSRRLVELNEMRARTDDVLPLDARCTCRHLLAGSSAPAVTQ